MSGFEGSLALKLNFGEVSTRVTSTGAGGRVSFRLATVHRELTAPDKYSLLDRRRRHAQINARRMMALMETER